MAAHGFQQSFGILAADDCDQLSFIGDIDWVHAQHFTSSSHSLRHGQLVFMVDNPNLRGARNFVEGRCHTAACGVAQHTQAAPARLALQHRRDQAIQRRTIAFD